MAPDFTGINQDGHQVSLADYLTKDYLYLVFNRGLSWPHCRRHMTQLRDDYRELQARGIEVLAVGPDKVDKLAAFWQAQSIPFDGIADPTHKITKQYGQESKLLKLGRMPAQFILDQGGQIRFTHYSDSMKDIVANQEILSLVEKLNR